MGEYGRDGAPKARAQRAGGHLLKYLRQYGGIRAAAFDLGGGYGIADIL